ncbi:ATP-dependent DNA ligase, partial [Streptomyces sp. URMC 123]|uniref:ATP-dependent DNA ligase n=1 Tax=Streptomyces sp. URMC 123 TaxID=3423403 RepID=UPI003F1BD72D
APLPPPPEAVVTVLRPPLGVALARRVHALPRGRVAYEPKFDGHRVVIFHDERDTVLQARSGRIVTRAFPDLVAAARALPAGAVVDGEVVVWRAGRTDFAAVQKRAMAASAVRAAALARELPASYAAFDLLALGTDDLRALPYARRRALLLDVLEPLGPPLQAVPMTTDPELALTWYEALPDIGVEGLVVKGLEMPYRGGRRIWEKLRHSDTRDAAVVGVIGTRDHPDALVLVLPGNDAPVASRFLTTAVRHQVAPLLGALPAVGERDPGAATIGDGTVYEPVPPELTVEVRQDTVRPGMIEVLRPRGPD